MACDLDNVLHRNGMMGSVPLLRLFWVLFVILVKTHWFVHGAQDCHPIDQCSCKLSDGRIISLRQIDKGDGKGYVAVRISYLDRTFIILPTLFSIGMTLPTKVITVLSNSVSVNRRKAKCTEAVWLVMICRDSSCSPV